MKEQQIRYIQAVDQYHSFSRAAQALGISQPTLSLAVQKIEAQYGLPFLDRTEREIKLTQAGQVFLETGCRMLDEEKELSNRLQDIKRSNARRIIIGISPHRCSRIMPYVLPSFYSRYPDIQIVLDERINQALENGAEHAEFDFFLSAHPPSDELFHSIPLYEEEIFLGVGKTLAINGELSAKAETEDGLSTVDFKLLKNARFLSLPPEQLLGQLLEDVCRKMDMQVHVVLQCVNLESLFAMIIQGVGVGLVPLSRSWNGMESPVSYYRLRGMRMTRTIAAYYRNSHTLTEPEKYLLSLLDKGTA